MTDHDSDKNEPQPRLLERIHACVGTGQARVEHLLHETLGGENSLATEAARYLLEAGGKRMRVALTLLSAKVSEVEDRKAEAVATAAELVHLASLLHDDILDEDKVRRGRPAAHVCYGPARAILAGDCCLAGAFAVLAAEGLTSSVTALARVVASMGQAELLDLTLLECQGWTAAQYREVVDGKAAGLIAYCTTVGGLVPPTLRAALDEYGRLVGRAFQIADDILDHPVERLSEVLSSGLAKGRVTLPFLLAEQEDPGLRAELQRVLCSAGSSLLLWREVFARVDRAGGTRKARAEAHGAAQHAVEIVHGELPSTPEASLLAEVAWFSAERAGSA